MKAIPVLFILLYTCTAMAQDTSQAKYYIHLGAVDINSRHNAADEIVKKAFQQTARALAHYSMRSEYTEHIIENGEQRRAAEATVIIEDDPGNDQGFFCAEDVFIMKANKSGSSQCIPDPGKVNHLNEMLAWNPVRNQRLLGNIKKYSCRIDSLVNYNDAAVYAITYESKGRHKGTLYIDTLNYNILRCTHIVKPDEKTIGLNDSRAMKWKERTITVAYKQHEGKLYPERFSYSFGIDLLSDEKTQCSYLVNNELRFAYHEPAKKDASVKMDKRKDLYLQLK